MSTRHFKTSNTKSHKIKPMRYFNFFRATLVMVCMLLGVNYAKAQFSTAAAYPFTASNKTFTYLSGGTSVSWTYGSVDDDYAPNIPIGFTFKFCNVNYTTITAMTNGFMVFGYNSNYYYYPANTSYLPYVSPCVFAGWCDAMGNPGPATYLTTGSAPNRVFTLEFKNWSNWSGSPTAYITYQYKLYEGTNAIELHYKQESGTAGFASQAAIGIANSASDWQTLSNTGASPVSSSIVFNNSSIAGTRPATGQSYMWGIMKKGMNNAAVAGVASPTGAFCSGVTLPVSVTIKNGGFNQINNVKVYWILDGGSPTLINSSTLLDTIGGSGSNSTVINLGNIFFGATGHTFKVYTSLPNGVADTVNSDDTLSFALAASLSGVYTIGGASPDFPDVVSAASALATRGVCGPVTFKIRAGTYVGQVVLPSINGSSSTNRITFQADDNVPASAVNITYASPSSGQGTVQMNGVNYVSFKNLTINNSGSSYAYSFYFNSSSLSDSILGCNLTVPSATTTAYSCISTTTSSGNNYHGLVIQNCNLTGGTGIYYLYCNSGTPSTGVVIENNTINAYYIGMAYLYYVNGIKIRNNTVLGASSSSYMGMYYIYQYGANQPCDISNNLIKGFYGYGLMTYYPYGTSSNRGKIMNNVVISNPNTTSNYGMMIYYPNYVDVANNTSIMVGPSATSYAAYLYWASYTGSRAYNNAFQNYTGGYALYGYFYTGYSQSCDYNNYYTTGSNVVYDVYNGLSYTNIDLWRKSSFATNVGNLDRNSISYDAGLDKNTGMPDPSNPGVWSVNGRGMQIAGYNKDKAGNNRPDVVTAGVPDIGAYEVEPQVEPPYATAVPATATPGSKQFFIFGYDTVAAINWNSTLGITAPLQVKQYSGRKAPAFVSPNRYMYFYTDIQATANGTTFNYNPEIYYYDTWLGTIPVEGNLKLAHRYQANPWIAYNGTASQVNVSRNIISANNLTAFGSFTGIDTNIFSAYVKPMSSTIICSGSYVTLKANTGSGYTYQWSKNGNPIPGATADSLNASSAGDYTVAVTSGSQTAVSIAITVAVIAPPMALVTASGPLTYCTGNGLQLAASTGSGLTYQWQLNGNNINGATNSTYSVSGPGSYTVIVRNIACGTTSPAAVVTPGPLNVNLGMDTTYCEVKNQPFILDAGYPGAKYQWSTGDTSRTLSVFSRGGNYWVRVDAGPNCVANDTIKLTIKPLPNITGINYVRSGNNYIFNTAGAQNASNFLWLFGDGTTSTLSTVNKSFPDGNMIVKLIAFNECGSDTSYLINWATNVNNTASEGYSVNTYPNPANDKVTVSIEGNVTLKEVILLNNLGQVINKVNIEGAVKSYQLDVANYATGHYLLRIATSEGVVSRPINIQR